MLILSLKSFAVFPCRSYTVTAVCGKIVARTVRFKEYHLIEKAPAKNMPAAF